jgi:hypothetical protein
MNSPPLFTTVFQRSGRFSIPRFKKSDDLAVKNSSSQFWSTEWSLKETPRRLLERGSGRGGNPMGQGLESRVDVE